LLPKQRVYKGSQPGFYLWAMGLPKMVTNKRSDCGKISVREPPCKAGFP
jgi:hypothetical protein